MVERIIDVIARASLGYPYAAGRFPSVVEPPIVTPHVVDDMDRHVIDGGGINIVVGRVGVGDGQQ